MPLSRAAQRSLSPLRALTSLPSMVKTTSSAMALSRTILMLRCQPSYPEAIMTAVWHKPVHFTITTSGMVTRFDEKPSTRPSWYERRRTVMVVEISDKDFEQQVLKATLPVVVDFWAPWCGPCRMVGPIVDTLSEEFKDKVKFCKVNVDENQQMAGKYKVMRILLLIFFKNGQVMDQSMGAVPEKTLRSKG